MRRHGLNLGIAAVSALAVLLSACGGEDASRTSSMDDATLLVVSGGNNSCKAEPRGGSGPYGMPAWNNLRTLRDALGSEGRGPVHYLITCHDDTPTVKYYDSSAPDDLKTTDLAGFYARIDALRESTDASKVYIIGHSYGGWLAMKAALAVQSPLAAVVTVDPISRVQCSFSQPAGCTHAPTDITLEERRTLAQRAHQWTNFWQNRTFYLHSSTIAEAHTNQQLNVGHTDMDSNVDVWRGVGALVRR